MSGREISEMQVGLNFYKLHRGHVKTNGLCNRKLACRPELLCDLEKGL